MAETPARFLSHSHGTLPHMVTTHITQLPVNAISVIDDEVRIDLTVRDGVLADFLTSRQEAGWADEIANVLAVGVRGLTTMGAGATVKGVGEEIERLLQSVTSTTEARVKEIIDTSGAALAGSLDPAIRSSVTARALGEIEAAHRDVLSRLDPDRADSHTARLIADLSAMLGPEGLLQERLAETFDPGADESVMSRLVSTIDLRFREMRELIVGTSKRNEEAARGTAKGLEYEGDVVADLRTMAAEIGGCTVEATGRVTGALDPLAKVGDAVLTLPDATRVAIEAKNVADITLTGKDGILDELDRAMANRAADWGVCVSKRDAYPNEVGALGIYGKRILIVDDGDGVLLRVA